MNVSTGIDFDQYKTQAKDLVKQIRAGVPDAIMRLRANHPEGEAISSSSRIQLADTQLIIAREHGYVSWAKLKSHILFLNAVRKLDSGDVDGLAKILDDNPSLVRYHCTIGEYEQGYFAGATLLHHVAGNPIRCPLPKNVVEITQLLLDRGSDPNARTSTSSTIGLILTGRQVSEARVSVQLIDILREAGATDDVFGDADVLSQPIWNGGRATAEMLAKRGVKMDARHAAALGRIDDLKRLLGEAPDPQIVEEALVFACVQNEMESVRYLISRGAMGDVNVSPRRQSSALHNAAWRGHAEIVKLLLENGARTDQRDHEWNGTPANWATHGGHHELAETIRRYREHRPG